MFTRVTVIGFSVIWEITRNHMVSSLTPRQNQKDLFYVRSSPYKGDTITTLVQQSYNINCWMQALCFQLAMWQCGLEFFRNQFAFIFTNILNKSVD